MIDLIVSSILCPQITTSTQLVLALAIARRCGDENGRCFAMQSTLAKDTRLHPKTVARTLAEFEAMDPPLIRRVKHPADASGRRKADDIYLTLPAVMIPASGPKKPGSRVSAQPAKPGSPVSKAMESCVQNHGVLDSLEETTEETNKESTVGLASDEPSDSVDLAIATATVWEAIGLEGKKRSSRPKIRKAIEAALSRRPKGVSEADHLKRMFGGLRAYLASDEARKEGGKFEKGTHRIFEGDAWEVWLGEAAPAGAAPIDPELGTMEEPGLKRQGLWMELDRQGMTWDPERGPRPGTLGCRVSPDLQRQFGYEPVLAPPASSFEVL